MIENHRTGFGWELTRQSPYLAECLRRAGVCRGPAVTPETWP